MGSEDNICFSRWVHKIIFVCLDGSEDNICFFRWVQKKQLENQARIARGEDAAPDEDINKVFKVGHNFDPDRTGTANISL